MQGDFDDGAFCESFNGEGSLEDIYCIGITFNILDYCGP
jgi:hypothetical protein